MSGADILRGAILASDGGSAMTEDELLAGITEALTFAGWLWTHIRRSDGITMGMPGLPDIIATHHERDLVLAWELKSQRGQVTSDQLHWLYALGRAAGVDARIIRPSIYDQALDVVMRRIEPADAFGDDPPPSADDRTWRG